MNPLKALCPYDPKLLVLFENSGFVLTVQVLVRFWGMLVVSTN